MTGGVDHLAGYVAITAGAATAIVLVLSTAMRKGRP